MTKKWLILILMIMLIKAALPALAQVQSSEAKRDQLRNINQEIEKSKEALNQKKRQKQNAEKTLGSLNRELKYTEYKLNQTKSKLSQTKNELFKTQKDLNQTSLEYKKKRDLLRQRIQEIYKHQDVGFIEVVLNPDEFQFAADAAIYFENLIKADIALINELGRKQKQIKQQREKLNQQKNRIANLRAEIADREKLVHKKKKQKEAFIGTLSEQIKQAEKEIRELEESSQEIASFLEEKGRGDNRYFGTGKLIKPVHGWLSSKFGFRRHPISKRRVKHNGIDLAAPRGRKIYATDSGIIRAAGYKKAFRGYGKVTLIDHGKRPLDGKRITTVYAHQSRILVKEGEFVKKGTLIGLVGSTGYSTGPHLHFEIRIDGVPVNPLRFIKL